MGLQFNLPDPAHKKTHLVTRASTGGKILFCRAAVVSLFLGVSWVALPPRPRRSTPPLLFNKLHASVNGWIVHDPGERELLAGTGGLSTFQQSFFLMRDPAQVHSTFLLLQGKAGRWAVSRREAGWLCAGSSRRSTYSSTPAIPRARWIWNSLFPQRAGGQLGKHKDGQKKIKA